MHDSAIDLSRIGAAVFDMGGVILAGGPSDVRAFGARVGLDAQSWAELRREIFGNEGVWASIERGEISFEQFCAHMIRRIRERGGTADPELAAQFMGDRAEAEQRKRIRRSVINAIKRIRTRMPTALLTNNIVEWRPTWSRILDVDAMFDVIVDSSEIGMRKPEPGIYEHTRAALGVAHTDIFFVDDIGQNLKTARQLGWQTLLYTDTDEVLGILERIAEAAEPKGGGPA